MPKLPFPVLSKKKAGSQAHHGSGPAHKPPAAAPRSLLTTEHSQDSPPSFLPCQRGRWGGSWVARASAEPSPPQGWGPRQPHRGSQLVQQRGNAETQGTRWPCMDRQTDSQGVGGATSSAVDPGRRKENQLHVSLPVPASRVPEMCKHVPPPSCADPVAEVLKGLKHPLPGKVPLIFVYKGGKQKGYEKCL